MACDMFSEAAVQSPAHSLCLFWWFCVVCLNLLPFFFSPPSHSGFISPCVSRILVGRKWNSKHKSHFLQVFIQLHTLNTSSWKRSSKWKLCLLLVYCWPQLWNERLTCLFLGVFCLDGTEHNKGTKCCVCFMKLTPTQAAADDKCWAAGASHIEQVLSSLCWKPP